jgi:starch phosphorylase
MMANHDPNGKTGPSRAAGIPLPTQGDEGAATFRRDIVAKLTYAVGRDPIVASEWDWFVATCLAVRDRIVDRWIASARSDYAQGRKRVYYLSMEFLVGRLLHQHLRNLGIVEPVRAALAELGVDLEGMRNIEPDAALGNGGLGRLAACFMESMATLSIPSHGYGIRYDAGLFRQVINEGWQQEYPETWLSAGNPWEFVRPDMTHSVGFGGMVEAERGSDGQLRHVWHPIETVEAIPYDTPLVGWRGRHVNALRLWSARAPDPLHLDTFNRGDHVGALEARTRADAISQILYPSDETPAGQELRLRQEYFFSSASLQDLVQRHIRQHGDVRTLAEKTAVQLNDTHPAIAVAELMRLLVDVHSLAWAEAWAITNATFSYTNHTLLPEALESWPVSLMERLLPRHMQIIYEINALHLAQTRGSPSDDVQRISALSLIDEHSGRRVRMSHLAFVGSHKVNGVSALHTNLLRQRLFRELHELWPERIVNKTNGITFRRWLFSANPALADLLVEVLGPRLLDDPEELRGLGRFAEDALLHERLAAVRRQNKSRLRDLVAAQVGVEVDPDALFDVHIKRIHEYKRQLLNILETIALYNQIRSQPSRDWVPRVKVFAGKAAASYRRAKLIIKLIHDVAWTINNDPDVHQALKVVFLPNYNVSLAEAIIPAADLSEQISTAGMEASGTGNMKLALNGALTIGTLDGANLEIMEHAGAETMFLFGLTAAEVEQRRLQGGTGADALGASPALREVLEGIGSGLFSPSDPCRYRDLIDELLHRDHFMVVPDFEPYARAQREVDSRWRDRRGWWRASVLTTAGQGWCSSDRTIREYAEDIWKISVRE